MKNDRNLLLKKALYIKKNTHRAPSRLVPWRVSLHVLTLSPTVSPCRKLYVPPLCKQNYYNGKEGCLIFICHKIVVRKGERREKNIYKGTRRERTNRAHVNYGRGLNSTHYGPLFRVIYDISEFSE